ncbi:hypothetical protein EVAR_2491_1 [Eumeta japonica]|uniref:Uncharacterized protein n=1 Tax=Eumeta variegata TaxID=151549 RepID=A0A4C1SRU7_EUMVA|nr:hypothetical protein EVAR_2491_1 [Eumeta japonica]
MRTEEVHFGALNVCEGAFVVDAAGVEEAAVVAAVVEPPGLGVVDPAAYTAATMQQKMKRRRHLGIGGHVKFAVRTENLNRDTRRRGERTELMTFKGRNERGTVFLVCSHPICFYKLLDLDGEIDGRI